MSYPNYYNYPSYQGYQPQMQQQYQQPMQSVQPVIQSPVTVQKQILDWVASEEDGVNYPLSPGQSIYLMNQKEPYLYAKSVDQLGKTTFIKKRLVDESDNQEPKIDLKDYIRREELENLITDRIQREVEKRVSQISFKPTRKKSVVVDEDEE